MSINWTDPKVLAEARQVEGCGRTFPKLDYGNDGKVVHEKAWLGLILHTQRQCDACLSRLLAWAAAKERADVARYLEMLPDMNAGETADVIRRGGE